MGNCFPKSKARSRRPRPPLPASLSLQTPPKASPAAVAAPPPPPATVPIVRLYGSQTCPDASLVRAALLYKGVPSLFVPFESAIVDAAPFLWCAGDTVVGSADSLLRFLDSKFPRESPAADETRSPAAEAALAAALQHRSVERHLEGLTGWAARLVEGAGGGGGKAEAQRLGRRYGQLAEVMLEHAQMEERVLFPIVESVTDRGVCKAANEEHARALPIINGIKEDLKSLLAMQSRSPSSQEALLNLSLRLKTLKGHFKKHFQEEEENVLPLLDTAMRIHIEDGDYSSSSWTERVIGRMEATHSHLFPFFMTGLLPGEAMQYLNLVYRRIKDRQRLVSMLGALITYLEGLQSIGVCPPL